MQEERRLYRGFMELHSAKAATTASLACKSWLKTPWAPRTRLFR